MRTITIIAIAAAAAAGIISAAVLFSAPSDSTTNNSGFQRVNISVNGVDLVADVASTPDQQSKGLGVKDSLSESEAMLFPFETETQHTFWMNGMKFPIDIIWLDSNKNVVHVEHSLDPCMANSPCPTYTPDKSALYVLETVAGFTQKYNVTDGTSIKFDLGK